METDMGTGNRELPESRLYTFIDEPREYALYFLEGQKLIQELALLHAIQGPGFAYFRDVVLSVQPMIALIKHGEQFGFYIDSRDPYFRLKLETGHHGDTRSVLIPETFREFPEAVEGIVRLQKIAPGRPPYESILEADRLPLREIVNRVLRDSYQVRCAVLISQQSDQSAMLHQLPPIPGKEDYELSQEAVDGRRAETAGALSGFFAKALHHPDEIHEALAGLGWRLLAQRPVRLRCNCSRERMVRGLQTLTRADRDSLLRPGEESVETICEYCKSRYRISRRELEDTPSVH
jgi:molecular chaperone Hsp33